MAKVVKAELARLRLRELLEAHLKSIAAARISAPFWVHDAIEGLHALGYGQALPIFQPQHTKAKGAFPYLAQKYRMKAVGFVDLLCAKGYKAGKARAKVSAIFGVGRPTLKDWQFGLAAKVKDPWMKQFREAIAKSEHWNESELLDQLQEAAARYKAANKMKYQNKSSG
jgi:hypothetical protein